MKLNKLIAYFAVIFLILYSIWYILSDFALVTWFTRICVASGLGVISWTGAYYLYEKWNQEEIEDAAEKAVLVTGCDTGFGHEFAIRLVNDFGFHVFASVLNPDGDGAKDLKLKCESNLSHLKILKLDVRVPAEVDNVIAEIRASKLPLWGLVNNAGIFTYSPFDWGHDVDEYEKIFDVNVFGLIRMTKACMPLLRKSGGRIVNVASLAGRLSTPFMGPYNMSKHSVRVFSDVLRRELYFESPEIKVVTIEPAIYRGTAMLDPEKIFEQKAKIFAQTPEDIKQSYNEKEFNRELNRTLSWAEDIGRSNVGEVVQVMVKGVTLKEPKQFYRCGSNVNLSLWAMGHLPEILVDGFFGLLFFNPIVRVVVNFGARVLIKI